MSKQCKITILSFLLFCFFQANTSGQELIAKVRAKCVNNKAPSSIDSQIILKAYPLRPLNVSLKPNQNSILDSMIVVDSAAVAIERARRASQNREGESRLPYFDSSDAPDSVVVIRKNVATVFPKMLLLSPAVASKKLEPNDFIATFFAQKNNRQDEDDLVQEWFRMVTEVDSQDLADIEPVEVRTTGVLLKSNFKRTWDVLPDGGFRELLFNDKELLNLEMNSDKKEIESRLRISEKSLDSRLVVAVLHRKVNPYSVRIIIPIKNVGTFGKNGKTFIRLFGPQEASSGKWGNEFSPYLNLSLIDSDIVEITTMDLIHF